MQITSKLAMLLPLLACISFAQSDANPPPGSPAQAVSANETGLQPLPSIDVAASNSPLFRRRIFALYPQQVSRPGPPKAKPGPPMEGNRMGYIENAIVGNQIRFRFDAGFDFRDPDRAEFFYAKCGCYRNPALGSAYDPNAPGPGPGVAAKVNFQELHLNIEYAPSTRLSFFADIPERSIQFTPVPNSGSLNNASGFGDFEAGFKFALLASPEHYLTFDMGAFMPTGDSFRGLGTNHFSVQPLLLYNQKLSDRVTIAAQFGDWHPINGSAGVPTASPNGFAGDVLIYGLGGSYDFLSGSEKHITPVVEFVGWRVLSGFDTSTGHSASGTNIVNAKIGMRFSFHTHNSIYLGFGHVLTSALWYKEILRLEYRYAF
jgi:hypothetical protein